MSTTPIMIEAAHYGEARKRFMQDPVVQRMAGDVIAYHDGCPEALAAITHDDGSTPRFEFMMSANAGYRQLGGTDAAHLGAVAEAIVALIKLGL